ncbi:MAG: tetratricopeptide repeat protein [Verrucomicrobiaceae bacterium]|nr:tetratricopeptide repeat protein [Verrucomicrobiaceae bacterium]
MNQPSDGWEGKSSMELPKAATKEQIDADNQVMLSQLGENSPKYLAYRLNAVMEMARRNDKDQAEAIFSSLKPHVEAEIKNPAMDDKGKEELLQLKHQYYSAQEFLCVLNNRYDQLINLSKEHIKLFENDNNPRSRATQIGTAAGLIFYLKENKRYAECRPWVKHVAGLISAPDLPGEMELVAHLIRVAQEAVELEMKDEGRKISEKALQMSESAAAATNDDQFFSMLNMARIHLNQSRLLEAEAMMKKTQDFVKKVMGSKSKYMSMILNNLGMVHQRIYDFQGDKDRLDQAEKCYEEARRLAKIDGDSKQADRIYCSRKLSLAGIKARKGELLESTSLYKEALADAEELLGRMDEQTLDALASIALSLQAQGKLTESIELYRDNLSRSKERFGDIHPRVGIGHFLLGGALMKAGRFKEAENCFERCTGIRERTYGPEHEETARGYFHLGLIREAQEDYPAARAYFEHVLKIDRKALGDDSDEVAGDIAAMARNFAMEGKYDEAVTRLNTHLNYVEKKFGSDSIALCSTLQGLANVETKRERYREAEKLFQRVIDLRVQNLGAEHLTVGGALAEYGMFLAARNKLTVAASQFKRAAIIFARQNKREGTSADDKKACIDYYTLILRKLRYDEIDISKRVRALEAGSDPDGLKHSDV